MIHDPLTYCQLCYLFLSVAWALGPHAEGPTGSQFNVPLDTEYVILETLFSANLSAGTEEQKVRGPPEFILNFMTPQTQQIGLCLTTILPSIACYLSAVK